MKTVTWQALAALLVLGCGGGTPTPETTAEPDAATDAGGRPRTLDSNTTAPQDTADDAVFELDSGAEVAGDAGTPPCDGCGDGATCESPSGGPPACFVAGTLTEEFLSNANADPTATNASWGGGVLRRGALPFGGTGADGAFEPVVDTVVDTSAGGPWDYSSFVIPAGVTVTVVGEAPWEVRVAGDAIIDGVIRSDGQHGLNACGPSSGPPPGAIALPGGGGGVGGVSGGAGGGGFGLEGGDGVGPGAGHGSMGATGPQSAAAAGAGGGGFGSSGQGGVAFLTAAPGPGGGAYGSATLETLLGGSGGGGGHGKDKAGNDGSCGPSCPSDLSCNAGTCLGTSVTGPDGILNSYDRPGGSGGGGGGAIGIEARDRVMLSGVISVDGGDGGWGDWSGGGGGGSGGSIRLRAGVDVRLLGGQLSARGGRGGQVTCSNQALEARGGDGSGGRIVLEAIGGVSAGFLVNPRPAPQFVPPTAALDGGDGSDGAFEPTADVLLNSDQGPFEFTSFTLQKGIMVRAVGIAPLEIRVQGAVLIFGQIDVSGRPGGTGYSACCGNAYVNAHAGAGGIGGPGGFSGGDGGEAGPGEAGQGPGGAVGGPAGHYSSAGGAGHFGNGQPGGTNQCKLSSGPPGGSSYGVPSLQPPEGGSGGGGAGDSAAAACTWCLGEACMATGFGTTGCPAAATCDAYCEMVEDTCKDNTGCWATDAWNPGSGGGGGGGALLIETPGLVRMDGTLLANGGAGGDSVGASSFDDGTCGPSCPAGQGCAAGQCNPGGGGSFGGSGGGGSGGAIRIRAKAMRAEGLIQAVGGGSGKLSQGGGCEADPSAKAPVPGQGRGGRGAPGHIRIETESPAGSIHIGDGSFLRQEAVATPGLDAQSVWLPLGGPQSVVTGIQSPGLGPNDTLALQTAISVDGQGASAWLEDPSLLPPGAAIRFRVHFSPPGLDDPGLIEKLMIEYSTPTPSESP